MFIIALLLGFSVPIIARRLIKIFPEDAGTAMAYVLIPRKTRIYKNSIHNNKRAKLYLRFLFLCFGYALISGVAVWLLLSSPTGIEFQNWYALFVWLLLVLLEVDRRVLLLPDILTIPLLILGFLFSCAETGMLSPSGSASGALFGYFIPVFGSFFMYFFKKETIGGGDIKILAAIGGWLGLYYLSVSILISLAIFIMLAVINKSRVGPYGPAICTATIITMYLKLNGVLLVF